MRIINPILNPSFEIGNYGATPTSWVFQSFGAGSGFAEKASEYGHNSDSSLKIRHTDGAGTAQLYQIINVTENKKYKVGFWVKCASIVTGVSDFTFEVNELIGFSALGLFTLKDIDVTQGKYIEFDAYVPTGTSQVQINIANRCSTQTDIYVDDISFNISNDEKRYLYKIYDSAGNYITTWEDVLKESAIEPQFTSSINFGCQELTVRLARSSNAFGEGDDVDYMNEVRVLCFDGDAPQGEVVFSGYISKYDPVFRGKEEYVDVTVLGYSYEFQRHMYHSGLTATFAHSSKSPQYILKDILDKFTADGGKADYNVSSTSDPGTSVSYTFNTNTIKEALDKVLQLSPVGWYYRVDPNGNIVYYDVVDLVNADHTFIVGRDVEIIQPQKSIEPIINEVWFTGGLSGGTPIFRFYESSGSKTAYGTFAKKITDERVTVTGTIDIMADRILDTLSAPLVTTQLRIMDNNSRNDELGYDIESIKVGQSARVLGYTKKGLTLWDQAVWDVDAWDYDLTNVNAIPQQIMSIKYTPHYVELELSNRQPDISRRVEDINRNLENSLTVNNPSAAT